jgi:DNA-binding PadR family transcriptional regulator
MDFVIELVVDENADCMRDILRFFALNPPSNKYVVEQKINAHRKLKGLKQFSHGLIHKVFKMLLDRGYIEIVSSSMWKTGKQTVIYRLTFDGLSAIYDKLDEEKWSARVERTGIPVFVSNHNSLLPLIFGKWNYFEEKRIDRLAKEHLDKVFSSYLTLDEVYETFFLTKPSVDAETAEKWMEALKADPDIRNYIIEKLRGRLYGLEEMKNELKSMLQGFLSG